MTNEIVYQDAKFRIVDHSHGYHVDMAVEEETVYKFFGLFTITKKPIREYVMIAQFNNIDKDYALAAAKEAVYYLTLKI